MSRGVAIDQILVDRLPGETRAALLAQGRLVELLVVRPDRESRVGAIIRGRIAAVRLDQGAAFVDIGADKAGYLSLRRGAKPPHEGAAVIVQVTKDAAEDKGAGVTDRPLLVGRYLTLRPGQPGLERARRLDPERFETARAALAGIDPGADGFMLHPTAAEATAAALADEAAALVQRWRDALSAGAKPPAVLVPAPDPVLRAILAHAETLEQVSVEGAETLNRLRAELRRVAPAMETVLARHDRQHALFDRHEVEAQIDDAMARRVRLPHGGELAIDELDALTVIDVDMAAHRGAGAQADAAVAVNLEAAEETARQLRLRGIGGIVVADFLRMARPDQRKRVIEALRRACTGDPQQVDVLGMTPAGLVELTRRRGRPSLAQTMRDPAAVGFRLLRAALRAAASAPGRPLRARAAPEVVKALEAERASLEAVRARLGAKLALAADAVLPQDRFEIAPE